MPKDSPRYFNLLRKMPILLFE